MGSPTIFNGTAVKLLKSILKFFNGTQIQAGSVDPSSVATAGSAGDLYISTSTNAVYQKFDSGTTTNWGIFLNVASGTISGPISLVSNEDLTLQTDDGSDSSTIDVGTGYTDIQSDSSGGIQAKIQTSSFTGVAKFKVTAESQYAVKTNNNATALTELVYGYTQQKFTGTEPSGSVKINKTKSGDVLYIRNSTGATINFIQNTSETFNGAANIDLTTGKTAQFVQFGGDGVYTVFIGP
jgi:hypothetical protein